MLTVRYLKIGYHKTIIENTFSNQFLLGDIVVVKGNNGVGKSTFFKTLAGLLSPLSGSVKIFDDPTIGWVDSHRPQTAYLTIENYLSFGINPTHEMLVEILESFKLNVKLDEFIDELSDGQFRKLSICRQFLKSPKILFLDEPSVYLDVSSKALLIVRLKELSNSCLIFCATHDLSFGDDIATRFLFFDKREIQSTVL